MGIEIGEEGGQPVVGRGVEVVDDAVLVHDLVSQFLYSQLFSLKSILLINCPFIVTNPVVLPIQMH